MAKAPQGFLGYTALLGDPLPSKWDRVKQALWDTNLNAPIRGVYNLMNTPAETLLYDEGAGGEQAVADAFDAAGGITVGSAMVPKPSNAMAMGIKAYHGSPHSFDKFSMDKIGTGEGAQAYGHGLYFAENEGVATGYRNQLSSPDGFAVTATPDAHRAHISTLQEAAKAVGEGVGQTSDEFKAAMVQHLRNAPDDIGQYAKENLNIIADDLAAGKWNVKPRNPGSMYEVNIDADPNAFLDWDKPLSEQPEAVRTALQKLNIDTGSMTAKDRVETINAALQGDPRLAHLLGKGGVNITGDTLYKSISNSLGATDWPVTADAATRAQYRSKGATNATQALKEAGIPGIKYLDAGSRGAGDGTRNYVVFDDKLISIVKKYGIAGASAMLGYDVLTGANEAQAKAVNKADLDHRYDNFLKSGGI